MGNHHKACHWLVIISCLLCVGCVGLELTKRYESLTYDDLTNKHSEKKHVMVSVFATKIPGSSSSPGILKLSDRGQMALVQSLSKTASTKEIYDQLNKSFGVHENAQGIIDRTSGKLRLVFSVNYVPGVKRLGDRITDLTIIVKQDNSGINFVNWDRLSTEYGTAQLGTVGVEKTLGASVSVSPTFAGWLLGSGGLSVNSSQKTAEDITLTQRYITISGIINKQKLEVIQEGAVGIDLVGNSTVDIEFMFSKEVCVIQPVTQFGSLWDKEGKANDASKLSILLREMYIPNYDIIKKLSERGVEGKICGLYTLRHVIDGGKTIIEGDDDARLITNHIFSANEVITLLNPRELAIMRNIYMIHPLGRRDMRLNISHPSVSPYMPLEFESYGKADEFLFWLKTKRATIISGRQLSLGQKALTEKDINSLVVGTME